MNSQKICKAAWCHSRVNFLSDRNLHSLQLLKATYLYIIIWAVYRNDELLQPSTLQLGEYAFDACQTVVSSEEDEEREWERCITLEQKVLYSVTEEWLRYRKLTVADPSGSGHCVQQLQKPSSPVVRSLAANIAPILSWR